MSHLLQVQTVLLALPSSLSFHSCITGVSLPLSQSVERQAIEQDRVAVSETSAQLEPISELEPVSEVDRQPETPANPSTGLYPSFESTLRVRTKKRERGT